MAIILLVDDEPYIRKALSEILECLGHSVNAASSGPEGLAAFCRERFDIVISDLRMPGMDGIELLTKIHTIDPSAGIILITGHPTIETPVNATNKGVDAYITKPFRIEQIDEILNTVTRQRQCIKSLESTQMPSLGFVYRLWCRLTRASAP